MRFELTPEQLEKIEVWEAAQDAKVAKQQGREEPYYGAIGGALTYKFTPNSLGWGVRVVHNLTNEELDVSDYESW